MKKQKLMILVTSLLIIIFFMIGFSYAYFTTTVIGNESASTHQSEAGALELTFNGLDYISFINAQPGDSANMTFSVKNTGTRIITNYDLYISKLFNNFINDEVVYKMDCVSDDSFSCNSLANTPVPTSGQLALNQTSIEPNTTHNYTLTIEFLEKGYEQNYNQRKETIFTITVNEIKTLVNTLMPATYVGNPTYSTVGYFWDYKSSITSLTFEEGINIPSNAFESWDVSTEQEGNVMAYIIDDGLGNNTYDLVIQSRGTLYANPDSSLLFYEFSELLVINNLAVLDTSKVTNMDRMFYSCEKILTLNLSSFDTANVTNMSEMINCCFDLQSIDLSGFNTSKVTTMYYMFGECFESLTYLDVSMFDFSNVVDLSWMFADLNALTTLLLGDSPTSSAENMEYMFWWCNNLTNLDVSNFTTSNVTNMEAMFDSCSNLINLDLSTFDTSNVTNMSYMFDICSSLISLDLRNADFTTVTTYTSMFNNITNGITITVKDSTAQTWITSRLTDAGKTGTVIIA